MLIKPELSFLLAPPPNKKKSKTKNEISDNAYYHF